MKTSLTFSEFVWGALIILMVGVVVAIITQATVFVSALALPEGLVPALALVLGLIGSMYPLYYGLNYTCNLCGSAPSV